MRFTKFVSILATSALACGIAGCSSDDTGNPDDAGGQDVTADASVDTGVDSGKDAGKDSTVTDAKADVTADTGSDGNSEASTDGATEAGDGGVSDAGDGGDASLPPSGSPCNQPNTVQQQDCGLCGFQKRACLPDGDGGYAWGDWGFCQNQVVNGCDPKLSYPDTSCGNCGTKKQVCLPNCNFDATQACTEPPNACKPGSTEFVLGLSCDGGGRERTCSNACQFGNFGTCQSGPSLPAINASVTVGQTVSGKFNMPSSPKIGRLATGTCPLSGSPSSTQVSYAYMLVRNLDPQKTLTVAVYHTTPLNGTYIDSVIAAYSGQVPPQDSDVTARKACITGTSSNDTCSFSVGNPVSCPSSSAGIQGVQIPPNGVVTIYNSAYFNSDSGDIQVNVYTSAAN